MEFSTLKGLTGSASRSAGKVGASRSRFSTLSDLTENEQDDPGKLLIKDDERYQDADGFLGKFINALDYAGNASRSAIYGATKGKGLEYLKQALMMDRYTDPERLRKTAGIGNVGKDDGSFDPGDVVDFVGDVATDVVTDPLNLLSLGASGLSKSIAKSATKEGASSLGDAALKAARKLNIAENKIEKIANPSLAKELGIKGAERFGIKETIDAERTARNLLDPVMGAIYGVGLSDEDSSLAEKLGMGLAGAVSVPAIRHVAAPIGKRLVTGGKLEGKIANQAVDQISRHVDPALSKALEGRAKAIKKTDELIAKYADAPIPSRINKSEIGKFLKGSEDAVGAFDAFSDWIYKYAGKEFRDKIAKNPATKSMAERPFFNSISKIYRTAKDATARRQLMYRRIKEGKIDAFRELPPEEKKRLYDVALTARNIAVEERNKRWDKWVNEFGRVAGVKKGTQFGGSKDPDIIEVGNFITEQVNKEITPRILKEIEQAEGLEMAQKMEVIVRNNRKFVEDVNSYKKELVERSQTKPTDFESLEKSQKEIDKAQNLVGLDFHTPIIRQKGGGDLKELDEIFASQKGNDTAFHSAVKSDSLSQSEIDILGVSTKNRKIDNTQAGKEILESLDIYARRSADQFLDGSEKDALALLDGWRNRPGIVPEMIRWYDKATSYMKKNLLYASTSWLLNNYWDNLMKTYVETGLWNTMKSSSLGLASKDLRRDIFNVARGKFDVARYSDHFDDWVNLGLLEDRQLRQLANGEIQRFLFDESQIAKMAEKKAKTPLIINAIKATSDKWIKGLEGTTGVAGTYMENAAKVITYEHTLNALKKDPYFKDLPIGELKRKAAKTAIDTFFDYSSVHHFEDALMKRMLPFYSFYKANSIYWADVLTDARRASRLANMQSTFDAIGDPLDEFDKESLPKYFRGKNARKFGADEIGQRYSIVTNFSAYDFLNMTNPEGAIEAVSEKLSPLIKGAWDAVRGKDSFTGQALYPSDKKGGKAYLYSRGFAYYFAQELIDATIRTDDFFDVSLDSKGNPVTTSDMLIALDKIFGTLVPGKPLAEQLSGMVGKAAIQDRENLAGTIINRLSPVKTPVVTNEQRFQNLKWNRIENSKRQKEQRDKRLKEMLEAIED